MVRLLIGPRRTRTGLHAGYNIQLSRVRVEKFKPRAASHGFQDFNFAAAAQDFHGHAVILAVNQEVY
jgi:hypothetical protein